MGRVASPAPCEPTFNIAVILLGLIPDHDDWIGLRGLAPRRGSRRQKSHQPIADAMHTQRPCRRKGRTSSRWFVGLLYGGEELDFLIVILVGAWWHLTQGTRLIRPSPTACAVGATRPRVNTLELRTTHRTSRSKENSSRPTFFVFALVYPMAVDRSSSVADGDDVYRLRQGFDLASPRQILNCARPCLLVPLRRVMTLLCSGGP